VPEDASIATLTFSTVTAAPAWRSFPTLRATVDYDPVTFSRPFETQRLSVGTVRTCPSIRN